MSSSLQQSSLESLEVGATPWSGTSSIASNCPNCSITIYPSCPAVSLLWAKRRITLLDGQIEKDETREAAHS